MPTDECNLVMKGGVTSGLVYARAVAALSSSHRFRSVAGSSAGAIAAGFVAAAEYARQGGDAAAFTRLQRNCEALPEMLPGFFQPTPRFRGLMRALVELAPGTGRARLGSAICCLWPPMLCGASILSVLLAVAYLALGIPVWTKTGIQVPLPTLLLGAVVGAAAGVGWSVWRLLFVELPRSNFGLCAGLGSRSARPDITDWIHEVLQNVAFGPEGRLAPLTFGDLAGRGVDLRVIASNLGFARMEVLPALSLPARFGVAQWARLFPPDVLAFLAAGSSRDINRFPAPDQLPVLVALRMSISCPVLLEAVPLQTAAGERLLFADGGLAQNFPFDIFDEDHPKRPTLAFDLATLHGDATDRVTTFAEGAAHGERAAQTSTLRQFVWSLLVTLREGANWTSMMNSPNRDRIIQTWLKPGEGGMDLHMERRGAIELMSHGQALATVALAQLHRPAHESAK